MVTRRCWTKGLGQKIQFADPETGHVFLATYSPPPLGILISQRRVVPFRTMCVSSLYRRISTPSCGPTRSGGFPGWPSFPRSASARAWPTTWGWARPCSYSRWRRYTAPSARTTRRRCCCARCRWSATGSARRRGSRPRCAYMPITGGERLRRGTGLWPAQADLMVTTYATATRDIEELAVLRVAAGRARRGSGGEEQPVPGGQGGAAAACRAADRADRDPGGEPAGRAVVVHGLPQSRPARARRQVPHPLRHPGRAARPDRARRAAAHHHPPLPAAQAEDRPGRHQRPAGEDRDQAVLPGGPPSRPRCTSRWSTT